MWLHLVAIGWLYVVLMMTAAELASPRGSVIGALVTLLLYGVLPLGLFLYIAATPIRKRVRAQREAAAAEAASGQAADDRGLPAADAIAPERKEV
jgi:hypothetical protein